MFSIVLFRVKYVAITAALLSKHIISVYIDISNFNWSPVEILYNAFVTAGICIPTTPIQLIVNGNFTCILGLIAEGEMISSTGDVTRILHSSNSCLLLVVDEVQKYYVTQQATQHAKEEVHFMNGIILCC
jgi:hypothetical protein